MLGSGSAASRRFCGKLEPASAKGVWVCGAPCAVSGHSMAAISRALKSHRSEVGIANCRASEAFIVFLRSSPMVATQPRPADNRRPCLAKPTA